MNDWKELLKSVIICDDFLFRLEFSLWQKKILQELKESDSSISLTKLKKFLSKYRFLMFKCLFQHDIIQLIRSPTLPLSFDSFSESDFILDELDFD